MAGTMAARLGPCDPELFGVLLDEAWSCRPSLESTNVDFGFETVAGVLPRFEAETPGAGDAAASVRVRSPSDGGLLPEVARRLGLPLRDLFVTLQHFGLPVTDDVLDSGAEASLFLLLGGFEQLELPGKQGPPTEPPTEPPRESLEGAGAVASRLLSKLLRDRRIGARHTRVEHAYGHHFADEEKALARRVTDFLERDGILIFKLNEGAHHVSVNPRRLREVGQIINGTWGRAKELERL